MSTSQQNGFTLGVKRKELKPLLTKKTLVRAVAKNLLNDESTSIFISQPTSRKLSSTVMYTMSPRKLSGQHVNRSPKIINHTDTLQLMTSHLKTSHCTKEVTRVT